jgi:mannosyl-3-phosphoglycerate phosphatase
MMMIMPNTWVIFTDLDGTLLDPISYSWEAARSALTLVKKKAVPLVICSSKTRAEIEMIRDLLDNHDPLICENGGGIYIPKNYYNFPFTFHKETTQYKIIELGTPYAQLRKILSKVAQASGIELKGFGDLSASEIAAQTGLPVEEAQLAKQREYDEPFVLEGNEEQKKQVIHFITQLGLQWTRGSRYYHLTGTNDKGKAVKLLTDLYKQKHRHPRAEPAGVYPASKASVMGEAPSGPASGGGDASPYNRKVVTIGLGDSLNDLPMLQVVDYPVLVQKPGGQYEESIRLPGLLKVPGIGPEGWRTAVLQLLASLEN